MESDTVNPPYTANLSHCGIFCRDLEVMKRFYTGVFDMQETDRGEGVTFRFEIVYGRFRHRSDLGRKKSLPTWVWSIFFFKTSTPIRT